LTRSHDTLTVTPLHASNTLHAPGSGGSGNSSSGGGGGGGVNGALYGSNSRLDQTASSITSSQYFTPQVSRMNPTDLHAANDSDADTSLAVLDTTATDLSQPSRNNKEDVTAYSGDSEGEGEGVAEVRHGSVGARPRPQTGAATRMDSVDIDAED
jgi:hypothetical protein